MSIQSVGSNVDIQRAKAEKFVNASDNTINRLARKNYNKLYSEENKKFDKRVVTTLNTLPFVAVASGLAMGKGKKGALMSGLSWSMALLAPSLVAGANKAFVKNPKVAEAERKHPIAALTANVAASVGAFMGLTSIADKVLTTPKVANGLSKISHNASEAFGAVKGQAQTLLKKSRIPETVVGFMMEAEARTPKIVKNAIKSPVVKNIANGVKNIGSSIVKNAPTLVVLGTLGAIIGKGMADAKKYSGIKADIKDAQFNTAKNLVNAYSAENKELKAENAKLASAEEVEE